MAWFKRLYDPIILPSQCRLLILRDAAEYIAVLPPAERNTARWKVATESLNAGRRNRRLNRAGPHCGNDGAQSSGRD